MIFIILFSLFMAGTALIVAIKVSRRGKPGASPESIELISVRDALMEKQGWSLQRAEAAQLEYVRFLTLLKMKPGFMVVPWPNAEGQDDLDQFWHQHLLDTAKYAEDCNRLFGRMLHHDPHVVRGSGEETEAVEKTQRLYARRFNPVGDGASVEALFLTGGGGDAVDANGHAHGNHSDGGHSDGGHSCGGHSCGGHSCGGH